MIASRCGGRIGAAGAGAQSGRLSGARLARPVPDVG
jgi:hypothetical protein